MLVYRLAEMTWEQVRDLDVARSVAILPTGAIEAHGPHLPLNTDVVIAEAMARAGAQALAARGVISLLLPTLTYTSAAFAAGFPGTVSLKPAVVSATVAGIAHGIASHGLRTLAIANSHFDPLHLGALRAAVDELDTEGCPVGLVFPDVTRRPWAHRLTAEFLSGACHAGRYEGSVVLAERPELVDSEVAASLPANPMSLSDAIRAGKTSFEAAGGSRAYFGDPAAATADEGEATVRTLGAILCEAVLEQAHHLTIGDTE